MIRVLLVDDEQPARDHLRELLHAHADIEIVGEAEDGERAIDLVSSLQPGLIFLDIKMPGPSGLEVAASLPLPRPHIVFCTAFDQYAVEAFEVHAVDYLLKPVNSARLAKTLQHVRQTTAGESDEAVDRVLRGGPKPRPRFLAKHGGRFRVVPQDEVNYLSIQDGITAVHTVEAACWIDLSLAEVERRLDPAEFVRISREAIVRVGAIAEVLPIVGGYAEVVLRTGERLTVSRRRVRDLMDTLVGGT